VTARRVGLGERWIESADAWIREWSSLAEVGYDGELGSREIEGKVWMSLWPCRSRRHHHPTSITCCSTVPDPLRRGPPPNFASHLFSSSRITPGSPLTPQNLLAPPAHPPRHDRELGSYGAVLGAVDLQVSPRRARGPLRAFSESFLERCPRIGAATRDARAPAMKIPF
jgi:hypothetical protein